MSRTKKATVAIVGAGLIGRLTALSLHRQGYQVTLLDKDDKDGHQSASYAAAGLLTPLGEAFHSPDNIVEMGFKSLTLWPELLSTLDEYVFFQQRGALMVSHEQDKGDFNHHLRYLNNHHSDKTIKRLDRAGIEALEPEIGRSFNQGVFLPEEGQIGNRRLLIALKKQLEKEGINWCEHHCLEEVKSSSNNCKLTFTSKEGSKTLAFDLVIDCRGTGAKASSNSQHTKPLKELRAVRGELFQLYAPQVKISRPVRLMHPRYQLYIAPKENGYFVVGATEIESDDELPMTVRSAMELLSAAYSVHPGFAEANIRQHVSCTRPAFSDNQPKILIAERLIQVNGLYRHGFLIAPVVLQQITELTEKVLEDSNLASHFSSTFADLTYSDLLPIENHPIS